MELRATAGEAISGATDPFGLGSTLKGMQKGVVADFFNLDRQFLAFTQNAKEARKEIDAMAQSVIDATNAMANATTVDDQIAAATQMLDAYQKAADADGERSQSEREYIDSLGQTILKLREVQALDSELAQSLTEIEEGAKGASEAVVSGTDDMKAAMAETAPQMYEDGMSIGTNMVDGVMAGVEERMPAMLEQVQSMANQAAQTARDALDIRSPSRVFHQIGTFIGEGLAGGINDSASLASKAVVDATDGARQASLSVASDIVGAMGQMFGKSKPIAIAQALINTWLGATEALKLPFPANIGAFAQTIATGMSAVNAIKGTNKGGGSSAAASGAIGSAGMGGLPAATSQAAFIQITGGDTFSRKSILELVSGINQAIEDGATSIRLV